jgi:hypothetical protein
VLLRQLGLVYMYRASLWRPSGTGEEERTMWRRIIVLATVLAVIAGGSAYGSRKGHWDVNEGEPSQQWLDATSNNNHLTRGSTSGVDVHDPLYSIDRIDSSGYSGDLDGTDDYYVVFSYDPANRRCPFAKMTFAG